MPLPEWNRDLGFWANAVMLAGEVQKVGTVMNEIETEKSSASLSTTAVEEKK